MAVISVYTVADIDYEKNGAAALMPLSCSVTEEAAGQYEAQLTQPFDARGAWRLLVPGNILKIPCPAPPIDSGISGQDVDVYTVSAASAKVYAKPVAPERITYPTWTAPAEGDPIPVYVGTRVTYAGQNYESLMYIQGDARRIPPPDNPQGWKAIANYTSGAAVLFTLASGTEIYLVEAYSQYWLYIQTHTGLQGYVQTAYVTFTRTEQTEPTPPRASKAQLFRIYKSDVSSEDMRVSVSARHVSYDLAGNMVGECAVKSVDAPSALARLRSALLFESDSILATNITSGGDAYTGDFSYKNPINALLDPDTGLAPFFRAKVLRDNWDIFVYTNDAPDRGVVLRAGVNLSGVTVRRNAESLVTRVIPAAQKSDGSALMLPDLWVDSPVIDSYPVIYSEYLKVDGKVGGDTGEGTTWTEETLLEHMRAMARRRFEVDNADKIEIEIDIDFTLLGDSEEYTPFKQLQHVYLYDTVRVIDSASGADIALQVKSYTYDAVLERYEALTLGSVYRRADADVSGHNLVNGSIRFNKLSNDTIDKLREVLT